MSTARRARFLRATVGGAPIWLLLISLLAIVCAGAAAVYGLTRPAPGADQVPPVASAQATPSTSSTPSGDATEAPTAAAVPDPLVVVIGDEYVSGIPLNPVEQAWTADLREDLHLRTQLLGVASTGYTRGSERDATDSITARAGLIDADAQVVVFVGGYNDLSATTQTLNAQAVSAFTEAKERAPQATVIVVGPLLADEGEEDGLLAAAAALREAAEGAGATWADPIAEGWFADADGLIDGTSLTDAGEARLSELMNPIVVEALTGQ